MPGASQTLLSVDALPFQAPAPEYNHLRFDLLSMVGGLFLFSAAFLCCFYFIEEDAYIYFRFAENIAQGEGYVFNVAGARVEGGSSPLWLLFLTVLVGSGLPTVMASKLLGFLFGFSTVVLVYATALQLSINRHLALAASLTLCLFSPFLYWANAGLDTPLYSFALLGFVGCLWKANKVVLSIATSLTLLARPEALLVVVIAGLLAVLLIRDKRQQRVLALVLGGGSYGLYLLFRLWYFNDLQISPFYAKPQLRGFSWSNLFFVVYNYNLYFICLGFLLAPCLSAWKKSHRDYIFITCVALLVSVHFASSNFDIKMYHRFFVPCIPLLLVLCAFSGSLIIERIDGHFGQRWRTVAVVIFCGAVLNTVWVPSPAPFYQTKNGVNPLLNGAALYFDPGFDAMGFFDSLKDVHVDRSVSMGHQSRALRNSMFYMNYQAQVGLFVNDVAPKGALVAYDQMGQTAYFSGRDKTYIDMLGIMDKRIGRYYFIQQGSNHWINSQYLGLLNVLNNDQPEVLLSNELEAYILNQKPDLILINSIVANFVPDSLARILNDSLVSNSDYVKCGVIAHLVTVYKRKDVILGLPEKRYGDFEFEPVQTGESCF